MFVCTVPQSAPDHVIKPVLLSLWFEFSSELIRLSLKAKEHIKPGFLGEMANSRTGAKKVHEPWNDFYAKK